MRKTQRSDLHQMPHAPPRTTVVLVDFSMHYLEFLRSRSSSSNTHHPYNLVARQSDKLTKSKHLSYLDMPTHAPGVFTTRRHHHTLATYQKLR